LRPSTRSFRSPPRIYSASDYFDAAIQNDMVYRWSNRYARADIPDFSMTQVNERFKRRFVPFAETVVRADANRVLLALGQKFGVADAFARRQDVAASVVAAGVPATVRRMLGRRDDEPEEEHAVRVIRRALRACYSNDFENPFKRFG